MDFQGFHLDDFQVKAIESIDKGNSVVVSAATGTGKTLIADWVIDKNIQLGKRVIYTAPIKALSNQKFRDFTKLYGKDSVGIITGDVQINTNAQVLIMTTEIYRNMLLARDELIGSVNHVIFDEIHFISDIERGTIWEESLIFSPKYVRFVCLSATIPNAEQFAAWIASIKGHTVDVIRYATRAVPLRHHVFDIEYGITTLTDLVKRLKHDKHSGIQRVGHNVYKQDRERPRRPMPEQVVAELRSRDWLPCLYFVFSRVDCERQAGFLSKRFNFLEGEQRARVQQRFRDTIPQDQRELESVRRVREWASKGIGVHHAGLLPSIKESIELLFADGLLKVLFTTETFAVGLNLPARATVFHSFMKYDGMNFRYLNSKEYFQLAGRAGRRGIDTEGFAIGAIDRMADFATIEQFTSADTDPIISQFRMSYNTALHLISQHTTEEAEVILKSNFDYFLRKSEKDNIRIMAAYNNRIKKLKQLGYLSETNELTERGHFLLNIYAYELLVGEIFSTDLSEKLDPEQLLILVAGIVYEARRQDYSGKGGGSLIEPIIVAMRRNRLVMDELNKASLLKLAPMVTKWARGATFEDIIAISDAQEGDIIHLFRRMLDLLRQIRHATHSEELRERINKAMELVDRDVVKVSL